VAVGVASAAAADALQQPAMPADGGRREGPSLRDRAARAIVLAIATNPDCGVHPSFAMPSGTQVRPAPCSDEPSLQHFTPRRGEGIEPSKRGIAPPCRF
jgi:hypothetical protein